MYECNYPIRERKKIPESFVEKPNCGSVLINNYAISQVKIIYVEITFLADWRFVEPTTVLKKLNWIHKFGLTKERNADEFMWWRNFIFFVCWVWKISLRHWTIEVYENATIKSQALHCVQQQSLIERISLLFIKCLLIKN